MACGADILANTLLTSVTAGENFVIPHHDVSGGEFEIPNGLLNPLHQEVPKITLEALTTRTVDGSGAFDGLMAGVKAHLMEEYNAGRIVGAEYTKAYIALVQVAMGNATQFLLGRDQAYWAAVTAQIAAIMGKVQLKTASVELAIAEIRAANNKAEFGLTKLKMANEDAQYCINQKQLDTMAYNLATVLPAQVALSAKELETTTYNLATVLPKQVELTQSKLDTEAYNLTFMLPKQLQLTDSQLAASAYNVSYTLPAQLTMLKEQVETQRANTMDTRTDGTAIQGTVGKQQQVADYNLDNMLPAQLILVKEQGEVQRAQTLDTRVDGAAVVGSVGKQKALYSQQIISYQRSSEINAAKLFTDAWISNAAINEGLELPASFTAANVSTVLTSVKTNNAL